MEPFKPLTEADVRRIVREELAKQREEKRKKNADFDKQMNEVYNEVMRDGF